MTARLVAPLNAARPAALTSRILPSCASRTRYGNLSSPDSKNLGSGAPTSSGATAMTGAVAASSAERRSFAIYRMFMHPDALGEMSPRLLSVRSRHDCNRATSEDVVAGSRVAARGTTTVRDVAQDWTGCSVM